MKNTDIRIHRFKDRLAFRTDTSETEYLTAEQAEALKHQINLFLDDMKENPSFSKSEFKTVDITFDCGGY